MNKIKTLLLASTLSLVAGTAVAAQAPVLLEDGNGNVVYDYTHRADIRGGNAPASAGQLVEGRQALTTAPRFVTNQPVLLEDDNGNVVYDYTHRAQVRQGNAPSAAAAPIVEGRQALERPAHGFLARQPVLIEDDNGNVNYDYTHQAPQR